VVDGNLTADQRRAMVQAVWDKQNGSQNNASHARWESHRGASIPTTLPADLSATLVSVHLSNVPGQKALSEFSKQTGIHLSLLTQDISSRPVCGPVTLSVDNLPLLEAINELSCQAGFEPYDPRMWGQQDGILSTPQKPRIALSMQNVDSMMGPWEVSGPFAFEVQQISHSVDLNDKASAPVHLTLGLQHEPKMILLNQSRSVTVIEATDDKGNHLAGYAPVEPNPPKQGLWSSLLGGRAHYVLPAAATWGSLDQPLGIDLQYPSDPGHKIVSLRGKVQFLLETKVQSIELAASEKPSEQNVAGMKCTLGPLVINSPQVFSCTILLKRGSFSQANWDLIAASISGLKPIILDDQGKPLRDAQRQMTSSNYTSDFASASYMWWVQFDGNGDPPKPAKVMLDVPTEVRQIEVPISFENLPLP